MSIKRCGRRGRSGGWQKRNFLLIWAKTDLERLEEQPSELIPVIVISDKRVETVQVLFLELSKLMSMTVSKRKAHSLIK